MKKYLSIILLQGIALTGFTQLNPLKSQFYQNEYLVNPAMAGHNNVAELYLNYSNQWNKLEGSPVLSSISASMPINEKAAIGINFITDKSGLMRKNQAMGSFAYKVPFTENHGLRFGVSLSWSQDRLDLGMASSSGINDVELARHNEKENYLDGNVGVTYQNNNLEAQFSYLSLNEKRYGRISTVDYATFYSSLSYKIKIDDMFAVKPMFAYRGIKNYDNQYDIAAEWSADMLRFYTIYHSNESFTGGLSYLDKSGFLFTALYNSEPRELRGFSGGIFDLIVGYKFNQKRR